MGVFFLKYVEIQNLRPTYPKINIAVIMSEAGLNHVNSEVILFLRQ